RASSSATRPSARITCNTKRRSRIRPCSRGRGRSACRSTASSTRTSDCSSSSASLSRKRRSTDTCASRERSLLEEDRADEIRKAFDDRGRRRRGAHRLRRRRRARPSADRLGEPDITGVYSEFTTAPLERDPALGDKEFFTPEEY